MGRVETKTVELVAECGAVVAVNVPRGLIVEPSAEMKALFNAHCDPTNWKLPMKPARFAYLLVAQEYAACVDFFVGGHEMHHSTSGPDGAIHTVASHGYYHYVGA
jgi:hypothetical protein